VADRKPGWIPEEQRVPMAQLTPLMKEALSLGGSVELTVTGKSMRPLLLGGISRVRLRAVRELHRGDMLLYQRSNGAYVLHRLIDWSGDSCVCCGDAQWTLERGLSRGQVLAVVTDFARRARWISCENGFYKAYWHSWLWLRPLRRLLFGGARRVRRLLGGLCRK